MKYSQNYFFYITLTINCEINFHSFENLKNWIIDLLNVILIDIKKTDLFILHMLLLEKTLILLFDLIELYFFL